MVALVLLAGAPQKHAPACVCPQLMSPVCTAQKLYVNECYARCNGETSWTHCIRVRCARNANNIDTTHRPH